MEAKGGSGSEKRERQIMEGPAGERGKRTYKCTTHDPTNAPMHRPHARHSLPVNQNPNPARTQPIPYGTGLHDTAAWYLAFLGGIFRCSTVSICNSEQISHDQENSKGGCIKGSPPKRHQKVIKFLITFGGHHHQLSMIGDNFTLFICHQSSFSLIMLIKVGLLKVKMAI